MKSPGGFTAWLVEERSIPFVALEIRFRGGASLDAPGKRGAINLMTGLLEEGAGDLSAQGFARARDGLAAEVGFDVYDDSLTISARFLTENREEGVALLREAIINPRFDADAVERVRGQVLSILGSDANDPDKIASATFNEMTFGAHPYGSSRDGSRESGSALTREDLIDAKDRIMARDRIFVGASGDISAEELANLMDTLFADLPEVGAPMPDRAPYNLEPGVTVVDFDR